MPGLSFKTILFSPVFIMVMLISFHSEAQFCPCDNFSTSSNCGAVNVSVSSLGSGVFCINDSAGISIDSVSSGIDSIFVCWQDGSYTAFNGTFTGPVYHHYAYDPDTCPSLVGRVLSSDITICILETCAPPGAYSFKKFTTSITLHFKPHAQFALLPSDSVCIHEPVALSLITCANAQQVTPAEYILNWGDTSAPVTGIAYTDPFSTSTLFDPPIVGYAYPDTGSYNISMTIIQHGSNPGDSCGSDSYVKTIYVKPATTMDPIINLFDSCIPPSITFFPVANALNAQGYLWTALNANGTIGIANPGTATPTITVSGVVNPPATLHLDISGCCYGPTPDCVFDTVLQFTQGPIVSVNAMPDFCQQATIDPLTYFNIPSGLLGYQWQFPGGDTVTSSIYNPGPVEYTTPGNYTITCIVQSSCGYDTLTNSFNVGETPVLCVTPDTLIGCDTVNVVFSPNACPSFLNYNWQPGTLSFQNATNASSQAPQLQFTTPGQNNFSVTVSSPGCNSLVQNYAVTVNQLPQMSIINTLVPGCDSMFTLQLTDYFQVNGATADSVLWEMFLNGNPYFSTNILNPPIVNIAGTGVYIMSLTAWNSCGVKVLVDSFQVFAPVYLNVADIDLCKEDPIYLLPAPAGVTWFLNGNTLSPAEIDPYIIAQVTNSLWYSSGSGNCTVGDTVVLTVTGADVNAGNDTTFCQNGNNYQFVGSPTAGTFAWSGTGISGTGLYSPAGLNGNYDVVYSVTENGCVTHDTLIVTVVIPPVAVIANIPDSVCINAPLNFDNSLPGTTAVWDFGDASGTVSGNNVVHSYTVEDDYVITLYVTGGASCIDTVTQNISVVSPPDAAFTTSAPGGCSPVTISFNNSSIQNNYTYINWDFGNGQVDTAYAPSSQTYSTTATGDSVTANVYLTNSNMCGTAIDSEIVTMYVPPEASLGFNQGIPCSPDTVTFLNASFGVIDSVHLYINGVFDSSNPVIADHIFLTGATDSLYNLMLVAFNSCGTDTSTVSILVHPGIVNTIANATTVTPCVNDAVTFTAVSTPANSNVLWYFGDGSNSPSNPASHIYTSDTAVTVTLYASDPNGCGLDSFFIAVDPIELPVPSYTSNSPVCGNDTVFFQNNSTSLNPFLSLWSLGTLDSLVIAPAYVYNDTGLVDVTLTVTDVVTQCSSAVTHTIELLQYPVADFALSSPDPCVPVIQTINNSINGTAYHWDFGDSSAMVVGFEPAYIYDEPGNYAIQMTAYNGTCSDDTSLQLVTINPLPRASFYPVPERTSIENPTIKFVNTSTGDSLIGTTWFFGDGTFSYEKTEHTYADTGRFEVMLIVTNIWNCSDTAVSTVFIDPALYMYVPNTFTPNEDGKNDYFNANGWYISGFTLKVFDRFGEIVFSNNGDMTKSWDGKTRNDKNAMEGVYVYKIVWNDKETGDEVEKHGTVTLLR